MGRRQAGDALGLRAPRRSIDVGSMVSLGLFLHVALFFRFRTGSRAPLRDLLPPVLRHDISVGYTKKEELVASTQVKVYATRL